MNEINMVIMCHRKAVIKLNILSLKTNVCSNLNFHKYVVTLVLVKNVSYLCFIYIAVILVSAY